MGLADFFSDVVSTLGFAEAQAEAPTQDAESSSDEAAPADKSDDAAAADDSSEKAEDTPEESTEESEDSEESGEGDGEDEKEDKNEDEDEEEEEEEEEEEPEDIKPKLEEDCAHSAQCAPYKHHFDECVERVTRQEEDEDHKGPKEDCVEEFFHLTHCATACAAPKLWRELK